MLFKCKNILEMFVLFISVCLLETQDDYKDMYRRIKPEKDEADQKNGELTG